MQISKLKKIILFKTSIFLVLGNFFLNSLILPSKVYAQGVPNLTMPGVMVTPSVGFSPAIITGMTIHPENPLQFDFIVDTGDDRLQGETLKTEANKLINYFMATLTVPEDEMWVNLSPYEKDRIIAQGLGKTEMGRDMLAQDYLLKQLTASFLYPEGGIGKEFWQRVYAKAQEKFGTTEIPTNIFNKVWIIPQDATVYVNGNTVFVTKSHLKVMLEQDYLALESNQNTTKHGLGNVSKGDIPPVNVESVELIRKILLPEIEKEVNEGKNFSNLRQIYNSMILATWYKKKLRNSLLEDIYIDKNKTNGIELEDKNTKEKIYNQYLEAFQKGVYNYIKEDYDEQTQKVVARKYFSGGEDFAQLSEEAMSEGGQPLAEWVREQDENPDVVVRMKGIVVGKSSAMPGVSSIIAKKTTKLTHLKGVLQKINFDDKGNIAEARATIAEIASSYQIQADELQSERQKRAEQRGAFEKRIILDSSGGEDGRQTIIGKLVRDKIPEIIAKDGSKFVTHTAEPVEYKIALLAKLFEEFAEIEIEVMADNRGNIVKELTDLLEVLEAVDRAMLVGGIDFNANNFNLKEQGQKVDINFSLDSLQNIEPAKVNGILPVIINITPVTNFPLLLGLSQDKKEEQLSRFN